MNADAGEDGGEVGRLCLFCGRAGPLTREHVIAQWLSEVLNQLQVGFTGPTWVLTYSSLGVVEQDREHPIPDPTIVVRSVCEHCNNGWMGQLEDVVRDKLAAMVLGHQVSLDVNEQIDIAAWSAKASMGIERYEPTLAVTRSADRQLLASQGRPPSHYRVRLAHRAEVHEALRINSLVARSDTAPSPAPDAIATMLVLGWLVIQVWGGHGAPTSVEEFGVGWRTDEGIVVWPPVMSEVVWPPVTAMSEEALDQSFRDLLHWAEDSPELKAGRERHGDS